VNESDTIRAAVRAWIAKADAKADRKRAGTRKRS
jgi:Arc/MetJ-type ribon-helix-helix transcriptional regulator